MRDHYQNEIELDSESAQLEICKVKIKDIYRKSSLTSHWRL